MTEPIMERAASLRDNIEGHKKSVLLHDKATEFDLRRKELEDIRIPLEANVESATVLTQRKMLSEDDIPNPEPTLKLLKSTQSRFLSSPEKLRDDNDYGRMLKGAAAISKSLKEANDRAWSAFIRNNELVSESVLKNLAQIPKDGMAEAIDVVRRALTCFRALPVPVADQDYTIAVSAANELLAAFEAVDMGTLPEDVVKLFRAAGLYHGAPLKLLTDEVISWLVEHDMADCLRLHLSRRK